jgi:signal transduction histidine kinase
VKKDGTTMEILLSCYGVRNQNNEIERSLAVSVDVTEKNKTRIARDNLKRLSKNIMASQEREKAMVARELHDHLGQVLTALRIDTVWLKNFLENIDKDAKLRAERICSLIDNTIEDVRDMAYRLRPRVLDDLGLVDALESMLSDFETRSNVSCVFKHNNIPYIKETIKTALYRITQEAVTNALRHSMATTIEIELDFEDDFLMLSIKDNGCGFTINDENEIQNFGLAGMKERADLAGGRLVIHSKIDQGTEIYCKIKMEADS